MLLPKRVKYRRPHRTSYDGTAKGCSKVDFGEFGLMATTGAYVTNRQIEAARIVLSRYTKRLGKTWIRIFPHLSKTKKPAEVRMGSGKGSPDSWVCPVKAGTVMFEIAGVNPSVAKEALRLAGYKLPLLTKVVSRKEEE